MRNQLAHANEIDLFGHSELVSLYAERTKLISRINDLKVRSHRRIELQYELRALNLKILRIEQLS